MTVEQHGPLPASNFMPGRTDVSTSTTYAIDRIVLHTMSVEDHRPLTNKERGTRYRTGHPEWRVGWRRRNPEAHARNNEMTRRLQARGQAYIDSLKTAPCVDCGQQFPSYIKQFDHRDPTTKSFQMGSANLKKFANLDAEAAKCDVVCANCHAARTQSMRAPR